MNAQTLFATAKALVADDKGVLAMDESNGTCNERFAQLAIAQTEENRRAYREPLIGTPGLGASISGAMLPCNVILREIDGGLEVSAIDPVASMQAIDNPQLHAIAGQIRDLLKKAVEAT